MILLNFKIYSETFGDKAIKLGKIIKEVSRETGVKIIPVLSSLDAYRLKQELDLEVYLQHVDLFSQGAKSGFISALQAQALGIKGTLLNHSEHRLSPGTLKKTLKELPPGFDSILCLQSLHQLDFWAKNLKPTFFAYEPKELIGSSTQSVATAKPETIKNFAAKISSAPLLVGAGIKSSVDVATSLKLGAAGVLVASAFVQSADPKAKLIDLCRPFSV